MIDFLHANRAVFKLRDTKTRAIIKFHTQIATLSTKGVTLQAFKFKDACKAATII